MGELNALGGFPSLFGKDFPNIHDYHNQKIHTLLDEVSQTQQNMADLQRLLNHSPIAQESITLESPEFQELKMLYEKVQQDLRSKDLELDLSPIELEEGKVYPKEEIEKRIEKLQGNLKTFYEILSSKNQVSTTKISSLQELTNLIFNMFIKLVQRYDDHISRINQRTR